MSRGYVIIAFGQPCYGWAAQNLAVSLKHFSDTPILLLHDERALAKGRIDLTIFDHTKLITPDYANPAKTKAAIYDHLIFDSNLYVDVDSMAFQNVDPLFERLEKEGVNYAVHIHKTYDQNSPDDLPLMYWAKRSTIWDHYNLNGQVMPATQSSIQYIKKSDEAERLFSKLNDNLNNPIPLHKLKNQWGGSQPDELYLNIALAQLGMNPHIGDDVMFFGGNSLSRALNDIRKSYYFLSLFGGRNFNHKIYHYYYDKILIGYYRKRGENHRFKSNDVLQKKHSDIRPKVFAPEKPARKIIQAPVVKASNEKLHLITSWFNHPESARAAEFFECLERNLSNPEIEAVHLFTEGPAPDIESGKLKIVPSQRLTFKKAFEYSNENISHDDIVMFTNGDIYLDKDAGQQIKNLDFMGRAFALTRWDVKGNSSPVGFKLQQHADVKLFNFPGSQDSWIFKGLIPQMDCDFYFGRPRCDHRIAFEMSKHYKVFNPAKSIKTIHLHREGSRSYTTKDEVKGAGIFVKLCEDTHLKRKRLLINQPGHFGDIVICLPIAKEFSKQYEVHWLCPSNYHSIFRNIDYCTPVEKQTVSYDKIIDLSFGLSRNQVDKWWQKNMGDFSSFVQAKYELAGVDLTKRWELQWTRDKKREDDLYKKVVTKTPYTLVHDSGHTGRLIKVEGDVFFKPIENYNVFDWYKVIVNASEIICTDSLLANFIEVIPQAKDIPKLLHNGVNGGGVMKSIFNNNWELAENVVSI